MQLKKVILINLLGIFCLAFLTGLSQDENHSSCDEIIRQVGGPCLEGAGKSYPGLLLTQHRDIAGFVVGRDSFETAERIFGKSEFWESGDAAEAESKVCYVSKKGNAKVFVVISSNSEMSNGMVDSLRLIQGKVNFSDHCKESTVKPEQLRTKSGIHIGMSLSEFKSIMGEPSGSKGDLLFYVFCDKKELKPDDPGYSQCLIDGKSVASRCSGITARFINGKLQWIEIGVAADYVC